ncbi:hypothetical protein PHYC_02700 [Phycisphaerales bacterium]|nr:hypothetical protein PHYC_02700 [Phycisphaerales bacterium]
MNRILACVFLGGIALTGACSSVQKSQGSSGITASYKFRTLSVILPESARVPAVLAAAEQTVRARGYSVHKSASTEESGILIARPPRTGDYPSLTIEAAAVAHGTRVELTVAPFGDQEMSRSVLDGTLQRLGL